MTASRPALASGWHQGAHLLGGTLGSTEPGVNETELFDFIRSSIRSVWTLELLFKLRQGSGRPFTPEELVRELRASDVVVSEGLSVLQSAGFVAASDGTYAYAPASPHLDGLAGQLERLHRERPLAVTTAIFSAPTDKLQSLADAFRLKKD
jgi:hypothetical protein